MPIDVRDPVDPREEKLREALETLTAQIEAQAFFTAVMTDTWIEEVDDEQGGD